MFASKKATYKITDCKWLFFSVGVVGFEPTTLPTQVGMRYPACWDFIQSRTFSGFFHDFNFISSLTALARVSKALLKIKIHGPLLEVLNDWLEL